ncbi:MAG: class I SAM-dependent methyltransferase, partial [Planctomycetota bacterium]
ALDSMVAAGAKRVLIVGSGTTDYVVPDDVELVYTDVAFGPQTRFVADCHDLPFADETFDGVLAIAIFEHVADPGRCASEIHRVLSPKGRIYAATPFMQPVHMGRYDFTRFTYLGHRRLMRGFDSLKDGMALGPGSTFGWALEYYLLSFSDNLNVRRFLRTAGLLLSVPFKITDRILQRKEGSLDAAGGLFFYGEKREEPISDRELMTMYRGRDQVYEDMSKDVRSHF